MIVDNKGRGRNFYRVLPPLLILNVHFHDYLVFFILLIITSFYCVISVQKIIYTEFKIYFSKFENLEQNVCFPFSYSKVIRSQINKSPYVDGNRNTVATGYRDFTLGFAVHSCHEGWGQSVCLQVRFQGKCCPRTKTSPAHFIC